MIMIYWSFFGGNNSIIKKKADKIRDKLNNSLFNFSLKKKKSNSWNLPWSSFFSKKKWFQNKKKNNHVGNHKVIFNINKTRFIRTVNSFHHEAIEFKKKK